MIDLELKAKYTLGSPNHFCSKGCFNHSNRIKVEQVGSCPWSVLRALSRLTDLSSNLPEKKMSIHTVSPIFRAKRITSAPSDLAPLCPSSPRPFFHSLMKNPGVILGRSITLGYGYCAKLCLGAGSISLSMARSCLKCVALATGDRESGRLLSRKVTSWNRRENSGQKAKDNLDQAKARTEGQAADIIPVTRGLNRKGHMSRLAWATE